MSIESAEPTLRAYLRVLRRRQWWVILIAVLGLATGLAVSLTEQKQYSATAQLLIQNPGPVAALGATQSQVTPTDLQTELQLATSAPVQQAVRTEFGSVPEISASEVAQTNVIALTAISSTPARAARIANAYGRAFVTYHRTVTIANLTAAETQLQAQISSIKRQMKSTHSGPEVSALVTQQAVLKEQLAQLEVNGAVATEGLQSITPARPPTSPTSPKPVQNSLLGLAAGLALGIGAAFLQDTLKDGVSSKDRIERLGNAPVLAIVPAVASWKKHENPMVASKTEPTSPAAEAYRSLRTSVQFAQQERPLRTLLVTSPDASEGKTATVANLGAVFAQAGKRVVIVSSDLRRPRLGKIFGLDERPGLTTVLLGEQTLEQVLQPVPGYERLRLLGAGPAQPNPAELLSGPKTKEIFDSLRETFDLVLIDSPPALPVTDAMVLSAHADGTLLIVTANQTRSNALQRTSEKFAQAASPIIGIVLNRVTDRNGYGGGYGSEYGYRYKPYTNDMPLIRASVHANGQKDTDSHSHGHHRGE